MRRGFGRASDILEGRFELGGKAQGLLSVSEILEEFNKNVFPEINIEIPKMTILGVSVFDAFIERNQLLSVALSETADERIAQAFQQADLPFEVVGELHNLVDSYTVPLAIRSSGLLEDTMERPFAGVYVTKMIPNKSHDRDSRFAKLVEAIKFVWASTYFKIAKDYCSATGLSIKDEKMAVIIQEMVGNHYRNSFYPELSGVARSINYYPIKPARPGDGVVSLALGLGKTIVDGGKSWTYSPLYPNVPPPYKSIEELINETQNEYWSVNMGEPPEYDPIKETEYLKLENLVTTENDGTLQNLASTYDNQSYRLVMGTGTRGPRVLTFAPLLTLNTIPINQLILEMLSKFESTLGFPVEIEFAMTFEPHRFALLQVRPMVAPTGSIDISHEELVDKQIFIASETVLGNGSLEDVKDIVYVLPERFDLKFTRQIAEELEKHNHTLLLEKRPYILIVFGRLGTLDPWLGIPVTWGQICGASVIVEATQDNVNVELSQGSHYFHNIINLGIKYFSMAFSSPYRVNWIWLEEQQTILQGEFTRHVRMDSGLRVKVDGRSGRGIIRFD
jgi:hypothetical protein